MGVATHRLKRVNSPFYDAGEQTRQRFGRPGQTARPRGMSTLR